MANLVLTVNLDISPTANPNVIISQRKARAGGEKIRWKPHKDAPDFKFIRLDDLDQALFNQQSIDLDREMIRCNNRAPDNDDEFPYTIIVEFEGERYTSTEAGAPPGSKPVIRNR